MNLRFTATAAVLMFIAAMAGAQTGPGYSGVGAVSADEGGDSGLYRLSLAISSEDYPVTPGDIYQLSFLTAGEVTSSLVLVESDYSVNLGVFGSISGKNRKFVELKGEVQEMIQKAYPQSMPALTITSIGLFHVIIKGEIPRTSFVTGWGMARLSSILEPVLAPYSSIRKVVVTPKDGRPMSYDLFRAQRTGILSQDPYVRAGDIITISRKDREIEIRGEANSPGPYELLPYENIEAVRAYSRGFSHLADLSRVRIERATQEGFRSYHTNLTTPGNRFQLRDGDIIIIPSKRANQQMVFIEGSIGADSAFVPEEERTLTTDGHNRVTHPFYEGDTLYDALIAIRDVISPSADLSNTIVIRKDERNPIVVNTQLLLYEYDPNHDLRLKPFDRIIIPITAFLDAEAKQRIREAVEEAQEGR